MLSCCLAAAAAVLLSAPALGETEAPVLFKDAFEGPARLVTNAYALANPASWASAGSALWSVTAGSLFVGGGRAWTGVPDEAWPNADSSNGTGSAAFALATKKTDFGDVSVSFSLINQYLTSTPSTPPRPWDGVSVLLRRQGPGSYYALDVNRRDKTAAIGKKAGSSTWVLASGPYESPYNVPQLICASVRSNADGSVSLSLSVDGRLLLAAIDSGTGGAPIGAPGAVGLLGGNDSFTFGDFTVAALPSESDQVPAYAQARTADLRLKFPITFDSLAPESAVEIFAASGGRVRRLTASGGMGTWDATDYAGEPVASGSYVYLLTDSRGRRVMGRIALIR